MASLIAEGFFFCTVFSIISSTSSSGSDSDVSCLMGLKESIEDPMGYLRSTWNFSAANDASARKNYDICQFSGIECWHADDSKVLAVTLSGMGLKGKFPRALKDCTGLTRLDLSNNDFFGSIPSDIDQLIPHVTQLDLSHNNFSGEIPESLGSCKYMNAMLLNNNQLTGNVPPRFDELARVQTFDVSNNFLEGAVPYFAQGGVGVESYTNNSRLCGGPLKPCKTLGGGGKFWGNFVDVDDVLDGFSVGYCIFMVAVMAFVAFKGKPCNSACSMFY